MDFKVMTPKDNLWNIVSDYAKNCSWKAGKALSNVMNDCRFKEWERVIVAVDGNTICGYCTVAKTDCISNVSYTPYIGFVFVEEQYRGNRLSEKLIDCAANYLKQVGFNRVYIVSDHENLYEKYGFCVIDRKIAPWGTEQKIYVKNL